MKVSELTRDQLIQLKENYYRRTHSHIPSAYEIWDIDDLVSDEEIFAEEADTEFSEDDFLCGGNDDE